MASHSDPKKILYIGPPNTFDSIKKEFADAVLERYQPEQLWKKFTEPMVPIVLAAIDQSRPDLVILHNPHMEEGPASLQLSAQLKKRGIKIIVSQHHAPRCSTFPLEQNDALIADDTEGHHLIEMIRAALCSEIAR